MRYEQFIAQRLLSKGKHAFTTPLVNIATWSIALGVLVMIMSVSILHGFQDNIRQKIVGFGSHITIKSQNIGRYYEEVPIESDRPCLTPIANMPGVAHAQCYANKGGMIKTEDQIHGIIYKGMAPQYDTTFFAQALTVGRLPHLSDTTPSNEVLISSTIAAKLHLDTGSKVRTYFWQGNTYRARAFTVSGIYNTDLSDFDEHFLIGDLRQVQRLNGWSSTQVAGYEVNLTDFGQLDKVASDLYQLIDYDLTLSTVVDDNPATFSWLQLLNSNIILILTIMAIVCVSAIASSLLIMIFEKTAMIGVLKTIGASDRSIRRIFISKALTLAGRGIAIGLSAALVLSLIQQQFHLIKLDSESYSMPYVPVEINPWMYLLVAAGTLAVCFLALLLPATHIARIEPAKTIRME